MYWPEAGVGVLEGGFGRIEVDESGGGALDCEGGRYCCGMWAFSNGSSACNSVRSRVVEYLNDSSETTERSVVQRSKAELTRNEVFQGSEAHIMSNHVNDQCVVESLP